MLVLTRKLSQSIAVGDDIVITIVNIDRDTVRIGIDAPKHVPVHRTEVLDRITFSKEPVGERNTSGIKPGVLAQRA